MPARAQGVLPAIWEFHGGTAEKYGPGWVCGGVHPETGPSRSNAAPSGNAYLSFCRAPENEADAHIVRFVNPTNAPAVACMGEGDRWIVTIPGVSCEAGR